MYLQRKKGQLCELTLFVFWLGRQGSNLGMPESMYPIDISRNLASTPDTSQDLLRLFYGVVVLQMGNHTCNSFSIGYQELRV
jgi:hypothetical protein